MIAFICSFTGAIGDMKPRDQRDPMKVLAVLDKEPSFSVFDATERPAIANSLDYLRQQGLIEYPKPQPGFPWNKVVVTESGKKALEERQQ